MQISDLDEGMKMAKSMKFPLLRCFISFIANFKIDFLVFKIPDYDVVYSKGSLLYNIKDKLSY